MIWAGIAVVVIMTVLTLSLCTIASRADDRMQEIIDNLDKEQDYGNWNSI